MQHSPPPIRALSVLAVVAAESTAGAHIDPHARAGKHFSALIPPPEISLGERATPGAGSSRRSKWALDSTRVAIRIESGARESSAHAEPRKTGPLVRRSVLRAGPVAEMNFRRRRLAAVSTSPRSRRADQKSGRPRAAIREPAAGLLSMATRVRAGGAQIRIGERLATSRRVCAPLNANGRAGPPARRPAGRRIGIRLAIGRPWAPAASQWPPICLRPASTSSVTCAPERHRSSR